LDDLHSVGIYSHGEKITFISSTFVADDASTCAENTKS
jgi:hypothetical protein